MRYTKCFEWSLGLVIWVLLQYGMHYWLESQTASVSIIQWSYGLGYAIVAVLVLGVIARLRITHQAPLWRMLALLISTALAALEIRLQGYPRQDFVMLLAAAVVGASAIIIIAKYLPRQVLGRWFGIEEQR